MGSTRPESHSPGRAGSNAAFHSEFWPVATILPGSRHKQMMMNERAKIERYVAAVPKAELHVHLEGSIQPATLLALAQRNGVQLPVQTVGEMQRWFTFRDFNHFVEIFFAISRCLKTAEDYELIAYELGANMARQNARYAEVTFSPSTHYFSLGVPFDTFFAGL